MPELIPNSPAEPWDHPQISHGGILVVPFTPTDTTEAMEQVPPMLPKHPAPKDVPKMSFGR